MISSGYRPLLKSRRLTVPPVLPPLTTFGVALASMYDFPPPLAGTMLGLRTFVH